MQWKRSEVRSEDVTPKQRCESRRSLPGVGLRRAPGPRLRRGFTLVELTVVILILGILVAAATPRIFNHYGATNENAARQSLGVVREAIDLYRAQNEGAYPGTDDPSFKAAVQPYLKGPFPKCAAGNKNASVRVVTDNANPLAPSGSEGWAFNAQTGEFIINHASYSSF